MRNLKIFLRNEANNIVQYVKNKINAILKENMKKRNVFITWLVLGLAVLLCLHYSPVIVHELCQVVVQLHFLQFSVERLHKKNYCLQCGPFKGNLDL